MVGGLPWGLGALWYSTKKVAVGFVMACEIRWNVAGSGPTLSGVEFRIKADRVVVLESLLVVLVLSYSTVTRGGTPRMYLPTVSVGHQPSFRPPVY